MDLRKKSVERQVSSVVYCDGMTLPVPLEGVGPARYLVGRPLIVWHHVDTSVWLNDADQRLHIA